MNNTSVIVITGAAGFIGSCMVGFLNQLGFDNLVLVDEFNRGQKQINFTQKKYRALVEREVFFDWYNKEKPGASFIFHLGARTDTTEFNYAIHEQLNVEYSKKIWGYVVAKIYRWYMHHLPQPTAMVVLVMMTTTFHW